MNEELVLDLFEKGFSIDYIVDFLYKYTNKNFTNYVVRNGKVIFKSQNYTSKEIVKGFVYKILYKNIIKNRAI